MHIIFSLKNFNFLLKFCVKISFCKHKFSPLNTFMKKGNDPDAGDPKTCGSCIQKTPVVNSST
jgi:hypothetical protein